MVIALSKQSPFNPHTIAWLEKRYDQIVRKIDNRYDLSDHLRLAVHERNRFLLNALLGVHYSRFGDYGLHHALIDFTRCGDLENIQKMYDRFEVSTEFQRMLVSNAARCGSLKSIKWLQMKLPIFPLSDLLRDAFKAKHWRPVTLYVLTIIHPSEMRNSLLACAKRVIEEGGQKMRFFVQKTEAKKLLNEKEWGSCLKRESVCLETINFIMDPINKIPISFERLTNREISRLLCAAFEAQNWEALVLRIHSKIPPDKMRGSLAFCVCGILSRDVLKMEFLFQNTEVTRILTEEDWERILQNRISPEVFFLIMNPAHQIPLSLLSFRNLLHGFIFHGCWNCVDSILSLVRVHQDPDFLANLPINETFFKNHMDKCIHLFQEQRFRMTSDLGEYVEAALDWNCFNMLETFMAIADALKATYIVDYSQVLDNKLRSIYRKFYVIPTNLLLQISIKCAETGRFVMKKRVDKEITRRSKLFVRARFRLSQWWNPSKGAEFHHEHPPQRRRRQ